MRIVNVETSCRKLVKTVGNFHILEYTHDASVSPTSAVNECTAQTGVDRN